MTTTHGCRGVTLRVNPGDAAPTRPRRRRPPLWLSALEQDLTERGLRIVATATDGPSTVRRVRATRPDVLVLDLNLPGMRGDEVCTPSKWATTTAVLISSASVEHA